MHMCALEQNAQVQACSHTHVGSVAMWRIILDLHAQKHTHVHVPQLWHLNKFAHVLIRSPAFHSFQQTSPTVPSVSRLPWRVFLYPDYWEALLLLTWPLSIAFFFLLTWNAAAFLLASLSISQPGSQSIHKLRTPATVAHSQKWGKKNNKKNTQRGISNGEKQKQRSTGEQSVILGSVCVAEKLVWS